MVNVIEAVRQIRGDLHSGNPGGEHGETPVPGISQTVGEVGAVDEVVDEKNVDAGDGSAEELNYAAVVASANNGKELSEVGHVDAAAELALENEDVFATESAAPGAGGGGGGVGLGEEVVGGRAEFRVVIDVGVLGEGVAEAGEGGAGAGGSGTGGGVESAASGTGGRRVGV